MAKSIKTDNSRSTKAAVVASNRIFDISDAPRFFYFDGGTYKTDELSDTEIANLLALYPNAAFLRTYFKKTE